MIWGAIALFFILAGFFTDEIVSFFIGVAIAIIGTRRTVFDFNKIGAFVNISVLLVAGVLGGLIYFSDDENKPSPQEIVKKYIPKVAQQKQEQPPVAKAPAPKPTVQPSSEQEESITWIGAKKLAQKGTCVKQEYLDPYIFGKDVFDNLSMKLCPDFEEIKIHHTPNLPLNMEFYTYNKDYSKTDWNAFDFIDVEKTTDAVVITTKGGKFDGFIYFRIREVKN